MRTRYDVAVLVSGDADFLPVIDDVQRIGKRVALAFYVDDQDGLSPELKRAVDHVHSIDSWIDPQFMAKQQRKG